MAKNNETTTKFKVDISELKKAMQDARRQIKVANSEFKATASAMDNWKKSSDGVSAKLKQLGTTLNSQKTILKALESQYEEIVQEQGEGSRAAEELRIKLNNQKTVINNTEREIRQWESALVEIEAESQKAGTETERLTDAVSQQQEELDELKERYKNVILEQGKNSDEAKELAGEIGKLSGELAENKSKMAEADKAADGLDKSLGDVEESSKKAGDGFTVMKGALASLVADGIKKAAEGLKDFVKSSIEVGMGFESSMSEVAAISGATGDELQKLEDTARAFGESTTFSASEAADALKYMSLAGWDANQSADALGGVLNLAASSGMDLAQASDMVTDYLSAFGLAASDSAKFADELSYAQSNSNTSAEELGEAYKNCAANLNAAGQDVETTTSLLAAMANQGRKGSEAGTSLSAIMRDLTAKMKDGAVSIGDASVQVMDAQGNFRDLTDIVKDVENATNGMGDAEKAAALSSTFTADSISGLNLILNDGVDKAAAFEKELRNSSGAAQDMADTMNDNLGGDLKAAQSKIEDLKITLYKSANGPLRDIVQTFTKLLPVAVKEIMYVGAELGKWIPVIEVVGAGIAAYLVVDKIMLFIAAIKNGTLAIKAMQIAQAALNVVMSMNPVALVIAAIVALVAAFALLWNKSEAFRKFLINLWKNIKSLCGNAVSAIAGFFTKTLPKAIDKMVFFFRELPGNIWKFLLNAIKKTDDFASQMGTKAKDAGVKFVSFIITAVKELPVKIWTWFVNTAKKVVEFGTDLKKKGKDAAKHLLNAVVDGIKSLPEKMKDVGTNLVKGLWNGIKNVTSWVVNKVKGFGKGILDGIKSFFGIHSPSRVLRDQVGKNIALGLAEGITKNRKYAVKSAEKMGELILNAAKDTLDRYETYHKMSLQSEVDYWDKIRKSIKKGTKARLEADKEYLAKKKELNSRLKELDKQYKKDCKEIYNQMVSDVEAVSKKYEESVKSRADAITSSLALFKEFTADDAVSKTDLTSNLKSQVTALKEWNDVLLQISKREGVTDGFMEELQNMGVESLGTLKELNSMSDSELKQYIDLYNQKNELAKTRAVIENEDLKKQSDKEIKSIINDARKSLNKLEEQYIKDIEKTGVKTKKKAKKIGKNTVKGIEEGINAETGSLYKSITKLMNGMLKTAKSALKIHSPSRLMRDIIGKNIALGVADGIGSNTAEVLKSMKELTEGALSAAHAGLDTGEKQFTRGKETGGKTVTVNNNYNQTINSPKALNRLEIYRQTHNLLGFSGGVKCTT